MSEPGFTTWQAIPFKRKFYLYLGITLTEHLDFSTTAKFVAKSANRALGLLIAKYKNSDGLPYDVYTKLFVRKQCLIDVANKVMEMHLDKWNSDLQRTSAISDTGGN